MGTYATTTGLDTLTIGYTFDTATTNVATKCITDGENHVRKKLSKRYDLTDSNFALTTTTSVPEVIISLTEQYSEGLFYMRQSRGSKESLTRGKELIAMVNECLKEIVNREVDVIDTGGSVIEDKTNNSYQVISSTDTYTNTFGEDSPLDWAVDTDKLDDIDADRD